MTNKINPEAELDRKVLYQQLLQVARQPSGDEGEHLTTDEIFDYAFERLPLEEVERIDDHLNSFCDVCMDDMEHVLEVVSPWLAEISATPDVLASLEARLADPIWNIQLSAAAMVAAIGPAAATSGILAGLLNMVHDDRAWVRDGAVDAFSGLGKAADTDTVEEALNSLLEDSNPDIRVSALRVVRDIRATAASEANTGAATSTGEGVGLEDQRPRGILRYRVTADRLSELASWLSSSEILEREAALQTISALGGAAAEPGFVLSLVRLMVQSESEDIRFAAAEAIESIGPAAAWPDVLSAFANELENKNAEIRDAIAETLVGLGPAAMTGPVLAALRPLVWDTDRSTRTVRHAFSTLLSTLSSTVEKTTSAVRASIHDVLERVPAALSLPISPMPQYQADAGDRIDDGTISEGRIRYRFEWDRKSGDALLRFDSSADELENALIVLARTPGDGEELSAADDKFWFVMLERISKDGLGGRVRIKKEELPTMTGPSEITVRVMI